MGAGQDNGSFIATDDSPVSRMVDCRELASGDNLMLLQQIA